MPLRIALWEMTRTLKPGGYNNGFLLRRVRGYLAVACPGIIETAIRIQTSRFAPLKSGGESSDPHLSGLTKKKTDPKKGNFTAGKCRDVWLFNIFGPSGIPCRHCPALVIPRIAHAPRLPGGCTQLPGIRKAQGWLNLPCIYGLCGASGIRQATATANTPVIWTRLSINLRNSY